jgi:TP901 family phage tail tape measure protein
VNRNLALILSAHDANVRATLRATAGEVLGFNKAVEGANTRAAKSAAFLKTAFVALGVAAVVTLGLAVRSAVDFEVAMRNVNSIARVSEGQFRAMSSAVLDLSTRVPQSATTLAEGLYQIVSSGFAGADALRVLDASARAASAGLSTTNVAATAIDAVLNAYGLTAREAADVSDILFQTVNVGVVTFEELASQLGEVIPNAAGAGVAFDEVGAALAAMTLSGLDANLATTSLARLLDKILHPGERFRDVLRSWGFESGQAALDQLGLYGVMQRVSAATGGQTAAIQELFPEIRATRGATALLANDMGNYARTQAAVTEETRRAGATQAAFEEQAKSLAFQWRLTVNTIQAGAIRVGTALIPVLRSGLELARKFGRAVGDDLRSLAQRSRPAVESLGDALQSLRDFLVRTGEAAAPLGRLLASVGATAVVGALAAVTDVLARLAGFLADHPALVQAVALVYGGLLVGRLLIAVAAFVQVQASLLGTRVGLAALAAQEQVTALSTAGLAAAFATLAATAAGVALVGGLVGIATALSNARQHAQELREEIEAGVDFSSYESIVQGLHRANAAYDEAVRTTQSYNSTLGQLRGGYEVLNPLAENTLLDAAAAADVAAEAHERLLAVASNLRTAIVYLQDEFGVTEQGARELLDRLDFDPATFDQNFAVLIEDARELVAGLAGGTPAT